MSSKTKTIKKAAAGILAAAVVAVGASAQYGGGLMPEMGITAYAASTTVTWNNDDITGTEGNSFTKDGVTITAGMIDFAYKCFMGDGTFTTTLGNFTKIEVTADYIDASGTGWSGNDSKKTWTGNSSSVSFRDNFYGYGSSGVKFVFTIEPPTVDVTGVNLNKSETTLTVDASETLTATVEPADATDKTVTWTSSNEKVATVDSNGKVTAVGAGEATITVIATNGTDDTNDDKTATCKVTVNKKPATAAYEQEGEDFTSETETDNIASLWSIEVTPGTDAITTLGVKVKDNGGTFHGTDEVYNTPAVSEGTIVAGIVVNHAAADVSGITAVVNGSDIEAKAAAVEWK